MANRNQTNKGDPRCLGDRGLRPEEIVPPEVYARLGERMRQKGRPRRPGLGRSEQSLVRCYWYRKGKDGRLVGVRWLTQSRVVDKAEWVPGWEGKWIRGWVIWGQEYLETRVGVGEKYWKLMRLVDGEGEGKGQGEGGRLSQGTAIAWPQEREVGSGSG